MGKRDVPACGLNQQTSAGGGWDLPWSFYLTSCYHFSFSLVLMGNTITSSYLPEKLGGGMAIISCPLLLPDNSINVLDLFLSQTGCS